MCHILNSRWFTGHRGGGPVQSTGDAMSTCQGSYSQLRGGIRSARLWLFGLGHENWFINRIRIFYLECNFKGHIVDLLMLIKYISWTGILIEVYSYTLVCYQLLHPTRNNFLICSLGPIERYKPIQLSNKARCNWASLIQNSKIKITWSETSLVLTWT